MKRNLRSHPPVTAAPVFVSQHTAPALFGFKSADSFLAFVNKRLGDRLVRNGKTVMVDVDELRAALREMAAKDADASTAEAVDVDAPLTPAMVLARLGMRLA